MKQAKIETIVIFTILILYCVISKLFLMELGTLYNALINPIFWIVFAIVLKLYFKNFYTSHKLKKEILDYTLVSVLFYIILYLIFGLFVSFGKNPNSTTILGILTNFWITGTVIIGREYIRYLIINNVFEKQKKKVCIFLIIIFSLLEIKNIDIISTNGYYIFKQIFNIILPTISKNILFTYIAYCKFYWPSILYELLINLILWISPILPNLTWIMIAIIDISIPILLFIYIRYINNKIVHYKQRDDVVNSNPSSIIASIIIVIFGILFALGIFPIKPIAIASGSMYPFISVGDIAIIKKCTINDIKAGDIIEYKKDNISVVHRVIDVIRENGEFYITAKGDNNESFDKNISEDHLLGKYLFKIKYLGYPAVWLANTKVNL